MLINEGMEWNRAKREYGVYIRVDTHGATAGYLIALYTLL